MISDKRRLVMDLLKLGVCYRAKLSENDLGVYVEMIDERMTDESWGYAMQYYCGDLGPVEEKFMPTPIELIAMGNGIRGSNQRKEYERQQDIARYEERRRRLAGIGDELLGSGEKVQ